MPFAAVLSPGQQAALRVARFVVWEGRLTRGGKRNKGEIVRTGCGNDQLSGHSTTQLWMFPHSSHLYGTLSFPGTSTSNSNDCMPLCTVALTFIEWLQMFLNPKTR